MSEIYILTVKLKSGLLSDLQSDTIFGHFCWRMLDNLGLDKLKEFLKYYSDGNPVFTLSNAFVSDKETVYLPKPLLPLKSIDKPDKKVDKIKMFLKFKDDKKVKFIPVDFLNKYLKGENPELRKIEAPSFKEELRVSVEIDRNSFSSKEGQLFSYNPKYLSPDFSLSVFIKILNEKLYKDFECEKIIKSVFEIGYGKKKSSGYGEFEVIDYKIFNGFIEPENPNGFIVLSNYIPSKDDKISDYYYDYLVKYGKFGESYATSPNPFKKPLILIKPGSCFRVEGEVKDFYGRCTEINELSEVNPCVQNGYAFSLKCKI